MTRNFHRLKLTSIPSPLWNPGFIIMYERSFRSFHKLLSFLSMISYGSCSILPLDFNSLLQKNEKYLLRHFPGDEKECSELSESGNYILKPWRYLKILLVPCVSSLRPFFRRRHVMLKESLLMSATATKSSAFRVFFDIILKLMISTIYTLFYL